MNMNSNNTNTSANSVDMFGNILSRNIDVFDYNVENKYAYNPAISDEKYYSYYVRDFCGNQYLVPIDHPFVGDKKSIGNCDMLSLELIIKKVIDVALSEIDDFEYSTNCSVFDDTFLYTKINVSNTEHISCKILVTMCDKDQTVKYIESDAVTKIKNFQDLLKILYNDFNKKAIKNLVEPFTKKAPENPLVAWFQENE